MQGARCARPELKVEAAEAEAAAEAPPPSPSPPSTDTEQPPQKKAKVTNAMGKKKIHVPANTAFKSNTPGEQKSMMAFFGKPS